VFSEDLVIAAIQSARRQILVAAYEFTNRRIAGALIDARRNGLEVRAILDAKAATQGYSSTRDLVAGGIDVRLDAAHAVFHHKFIVVDGVTVEQGSYNYTEAASRRNAENACVFWNAGSMAKQFIGEWSAHYSHAQPYSAGY
jgi:phosphatidylserine/phosphatidylglycerophosphate/cardiolipin synthase-like enzyme